MQRCQPSNPDSLPRGRFPAPRWWRAGLLVWLLAIGGLSGCSRDAPPTQLLIENVNVVDPVKGLLEKRQVLIEGGVITAVADASQTVASSANAERFDGQERFLIPGLWDMHVHFVYDMNLTDHMADLFLDYGITSVRDTGGNIDQLAELRRTMPAPKPTSIFQARYWTANSSFMTAQILRVRRWAQVSPALATQTPRSARCRRRSGFH